MLTGGASASPGKLLAAATAAAAAAAVALLCSRQYVRRAGEPPLVRGLPFLGHAVQIGLGSKAFLLRMQRDYGPTFTLTIAGMRVHVVPPSAFSSVFRRRDLEFKPIALDVVVAAFGASRDAFPEPIVCNLCTEIKQLRNRKYHTPYSFQLHMRQIHR